MNETRWRKSTYSSNGGASCVEVGQATRAIAVRDTKQAGRGPVLRFTPAAWRRFAGQVKRSLVPHLAVRAGLPPAPDLFQPNEPFDAAVDRSCIASRAKPLWFGSAPGHVPSLTIR